MWPLLNDSSSDLTIVIVLLCINLSFLSNMTLTCGYVHPLARVGRKQRMESNLCNDLSSFLSYMIMTGRYTYAHTCPC